MREIRIRGRKCLLGPTIFVVRVSSSLSLSRCLLAEKVVKKKKKKMDPSAKYLCFLLCFLFHIAFFVQIRDLVMWQGLPTWIHFNY